MGELAVEFLTQGGEGIERQPVAEDVGQRAQDGPILPGIARREGGPVGQLRPALDVHVGARLLGIGRARQDHVGALRAPVPVGALVDHEGPGRDIDLVRSEVEQDVHPSAGHLDRGLGPLARHEAEIERADPGRRGVEDAKAVPALRDRADPLSQRCGRRQHRKAVRAREGAGSDDDQRALGAPGASRRSRDGPRRSRPGSRDRPRDNRRDR